MSLATAVLTIIDKLISVIGLQKQQATQIANLNNKVNGLKIGGRNLILNSKQMLRTLDASNNESHKITFKIASDIAYELEFVDEIVLSCLIRYNDIASAGSRWQRIGIEARIVLDNGSVQYPSAFFFANGRQPASFNRRYSYPWRVPTGRRIKSIDYASILIQNISSSGEMIVADPMLQIGNTATDWQPAPEDAQVTITTLESRLSVLESKMSNGTIGD